ncbi:hypothetical protein Gohar_002369, partial [Gossypium harknessii]|nr:hypothetical protein [Gossypium harknessii]
RVSALDCLTPSTECLVPVSQFCFLYSEQSPNAFTEFKECLSCLHVVSPLAEAITNSVSPFGLFSDYGRQNPDTTVASPASKTLKDAKPTSTSRIPGVQTSDINSFRIQQDKNFAVAQAQQDGCTGNFMKFDSWYGNFLVPVVPSRAEFNR